MAKKQIVELIDDLDQSKADETVTFGIDGSYYEIDLNKKHAAALRNALADYVANARRVSRGRVATGRRGSRASGTRTDTQSVREWARANGYEVGSKGRIPAHIMEAYNAG